MNSNTTRPPANIRSGFGSLIGAGVVLAIAIAFPSAWYDPLPQGEVIGEPAMSGLTALKLALLLDALALTLFALYQRYGRPVTGPAALLRSVSFAPPGGSTRDSARRALVVITILAAGLRIIALDSSLWLDEIAPLVEYGGISPWRVAVSYLGSNNHLLNTLLVNLSVSILGEASWTVRLPAALFGIATVPAFYGVARLAMSRRASLSACLLLAVSYHHIFFSQNARGYSAYMFFSLVGTRFFVLALARGRWREWGPYAIFMLLAFASLLLSSFVVAAHAAIAAVLVVSNGSDVRRSRAYRPVVVFTGIGLGALTLYAAILPQALAFAAAGYTDPSAGFSPFSVEFMRELTRLLLAGLGSFGIPAAVCAASAFLVGLALLFDRCPPLCFALVLPSLLQAGVLAARGLTFSPRFFVLALAPAILAAVLVVGAIGRRVAAVTHGRIPLEMTALVLLALGALVSGVQLRGYYEVPKQDYPGALAFARTVQGPEAPIIVVHLAETGIRYYASGGQQNQPEKVFYVRTVEAFDAALAASGGADSAVLITTFPRALRLKVPALAERIEKDWEPRRAFRGTVGDGDITIWTPRRRGVAAAGDALYECRSASSALAKPPRHLV